MKPSAFGIDFGTTNSLVCVWGSSWEKEKTPVAFWDSLETGEKRPHASVVWYGPQPEPTVGRLAKENMSSLSSGMGHAFVSSVKRKLGQGKEVELVGGARKPAWEVAAEIFHHLKRNADARPELKKLGAQVTDCVVAIPVGFDGKQRAEIRRAMQKAGLRLQTFLHEPFAAMVSHFYDPVEKLQHIAGKRTLVFDWGGGTLDICIVEVSENGGQVYELAHDGIADRAGDEFDQRMMTLIKRKLLQSSPDGPDDVPIKGRGLDRFRVAAESAKIRLSTALKASVHVPDLFTAYGKLHDLTESVERAEFEKVAESEIAGAESCVHRCLHAAGLTSGLIDHVLLVGGTSSIPAVRGMMERIFGSRVIVAVEPDAAIARGAAIVAAEGWVPYNVNDIGVVLADESLFTVLPAGVALVPNESKKFGFYCVDPRDGVARLILGYTPRSGDKQVKMLGDPVTVPTLSGLGQISEMDRIQVRFVITEDATVQVEALSTATGKTAQAEIHDIRFGLRIH